ncbi:hypothetical protein [Allorhodopirellula heiligendammensis]|uniref:Nickel uptake substrate-specific transmembrane region n=1 Tax=Allorhodopirellula heiligendammensis TaxID=2714739 RepID=A0A5C6BXD2_9BACT|nr:hypothetical protein [Allorhodopirellula heiligendammensis]TWU16943.1 hypothetical protein Poly21_41520 [Allorhodopirellula heiligendammensis]
MNHAQLTPPSVKSLLSLACLCVFSVGCGNHEHWHVDTSPVHGTVRINGEIPKGAQVTFYPTGGAVDVRESKPWGMVDETGTYELRTYEKGDGSPAGEYRATIIWRENPSVLGSPDQLGGAFEAPSDSEWIFTIDEDVTELPPIEITDAKIIKPTTRSRSRNPSPFDEPEDT